MMHLRSHARRIVQSTLLLLVAPFCAHAQSGVFTLKIGTTAPPPVPLVRNQNFWHLHKGTNAPQADWKLTDDDLLNPTAWASGQGGALHFYGAGSWGPPAADELLGRDDRAWRAP